MNYSKEELVTALGVDALEPAMQDQVLASFLDTLEMRTGQAVSDALSEDQLKQFNTVVDEQGDEAAENWLRQTVPNFDSIEDQQVEILIAEVQANGELGE